MKRIAIAALAALSIITPAWSGGAKDKTTTETGPVEITVWTHEDVNRKAIEEGYIAEFMAANPNVTVKYVTYPSDKIQDVVQAGFAAKNGPDIFNMEIQKAYPFLAEGFVAPVNLAASGYKSYGDIQGKYMAVITSYSIHYTKLYETSSLPPPRKVDQSRALPVGSRQAT